MIWDILQESSFNDYFSQGSLGSLTAQALLLDENIITEFKNLNPQLIEQQFCFKQSVQGHYDQFLSRLIEYTIKLPKESDGEDRVRKLPYVSSEVLAIDNSNVYKAFFDWSKDYFHQLMGIFNTQAKDNEILTGYFVKILQNLYKCEKKKTAQKIYSFRQVFFQNLDKESVATVFTLFLVLLQTEEGFMLDQRKEVTQKLIEQLVNGNENIKNVCKNVLVEVISKFQTFSSGDQLLNQIMNSQTLLQLFQIEESQAVDQFLVGYMAKALQKICTSGQYQKSLLEIPENHKEGIKKFISLRKHLLKNSQSLTSGFKNQSRTQVYRLDKNVTILLTLIKLALENSIIGFLTQEDILALFSIVTSHPSNDIIKVKIFDIFALIYTKKDTQSQQGFGKYFYVKGIELFQTNKKMFGHFLFQLWRIINKKISKDHFDVKHEEKWTQLVKYFEQLENYQKQAQKVVDRYSSLTKVTKLVVDEEDTTPTVSSSANVSQQSKEFSGQKTNNTIKNSDGFQKMNETKPQPVQQAQKPQTTTNNSKDAFSFDFFASSSPTIVPQLKSENKLQTKPKVDPFTAFDFFAPKTTKPQQTKTQDKKKPDFNDFSFFF